MIGKFSEKPAEKLPLESSQEPIGNPEKTLAEPAHTPLIEKIAPEPVQKLAEKPTEKIIEKPKSVAIKPAKIKAPSKLEMAFSRIFDRVALQDKINFARHLALVVKAGLPIFE